MFRFKDLMKQAVGKQPNDKTGIQLLASILVCYPEIESVTYEPENTEMVMDFIIEGKADGRRSDDDIIVYSVGGMPVEDVAWGCSVYRRAKELGIGVKLNLWDAPLMA